MSQIIVNVKLQPLKTQLEFFFSRKPGPSQPPPWEESRQTTFPINSQAPKMVSEAFYFILFYLIFI